MADKVKLHRKHLVQTLLASARTLKVEPVRDSAKRAKVEGMMALIRQAKAPKKQRKAAEEAKKQAEEAFTKYLASFAKGAGEQPGQQQPQQPEFRVRGRSLLLTYNWDYFNEAFPDGQPAAASKEELWKLWMQWCEESQKALGVTQDTSTLEASLHSADGDRVHFHRKLNLAKPVDESDTSKFAFHGVRPNAQSTKVEAAETRKARGANFKEASNRAHFYTWVPKVGTLFVATNWRPWQDYRVLGKWLDDLWTDGKLDHDTYDNLALKVRVGYAGRKRDLEAVLTSEREERVDKQVAEVNKELAKLSAPFRVFAAVTAWENSYLHLNFRWQLLVLVADSASGKSNFAEHLFENPCVLTVEDATFLDLKNFDKDRHDGLVLDNVNTWGQLRKWRAVLQARNAKSRGGQSATNLYSYVQYLYGVPVVATVDLDAPDSHLVDPQSEKCSKWLCKNCTFVRLAPGECFYDKTKVPKTKVENRFSLFAQTVKRRRSQSQGKL